MNHTRNLFSRRPGMTLVELLIVLVILAVLTTVAVQSTTGLVDQAHYDASQSTLQNVQNGIVGPTGQREPDGTPLVTGFVADMGRLPQATLDATGTGALTLNELWIQPAGVTAYGPQFATAPDTDVMLQCGWRGPYLQLPLGTTQLLDGYGNPLSLLQSDGMTPVIAGQPIPWIRSLGADFAAGGTGYAADTDLVFVSTVAGNTTNRVQATLSVNVNFITLAGQQTTAPANGTVTNLMVTYFGPNSATGQVQSLQNPTPVSGTTFSFPRAGTTDFITIGPRAFRATCTYTPTGGSAVLLKSPITRLVLLPGGQTKDVFIQLPN